MKPAPDARQSQEWRLRCPTPRRHDVVTLAHGGGGRLTRELTETLFLPAFASAAASARHDSAVVSLGGARLAMSTDSYVVHPLFFPGGDIGKLAVYGTVNDLLMAGARPAYLSVGFVIEEGLPIVELERVVASMREAASRCAVELVTGDTKVVDRGKGDGLFLNTSGIGLVPEGLIVAPQRLCPGDAVLLSGDVGRHGVAVLSVRQGLEFDSSVESDCAPLCELVTALFKAQVELHCLRDPTRGGVATALNELALDGNVGIELDESAVPIEDQVAGACEIFGLDPLYVACEGRMLAIVPRSDAARALDALRSCESGAAAVCIGSVVSEHRGTVVLRTRFGSQRLLDLLSGEQLPRIC